MDALSSDRMEFGFGVDPFNPRSPRPIDVVGGLQKNELRRQLIESCPRVPGVYGMLDRHGDLIYVGKSKSLRSRLLSYFSAANEDEKSGRIIENTRVIQWETQPSEFAALLREQQLIRQFIPRWNVQGVPKRQRPVYLCLGRGSVPTFYLSPKVPTDYLAIQGPFFGTSRMNVAVDALNKVFRLRDCSQQQVFQFSEQLSLFDLEHRAGCLRFELGTCSGPCAAACTRAEYFQQVAAAESFLDGFNDEPLTALEEQMQSAAANQQYELAGRVHRTLKSIQYVHRKLTMLAEARRRFSFVYAVPGYDGCHNWYLLHGGEVISVAATPIGRDAYMAMKPVIKHWRALLEGPTDHVHGPFPYSLGIVASWFRKHKRELERTFAPEQSGRKYYRKSMRSQAS
ncbi:GIY-YIG nuclease family protein [Roseiconus lacunae]|uniref:GIY-YIG nuclease family protein n=2 Tax=Roseiconus lacunae TaxID=2605694 RepID=UPI001E462116|nr:GIY-YIG nuclease family protein [Roseiconus lacunae]MCD0459041.1 GIY-YIG nuclease family protein [Roseiconus lacunae]